MAEQSINLLADKILQGMSQAIEVGFRAAMQSGSINQSVETDQQISYLGPSNSSSKDSRTTTQHALATFQSVLPQTGVTSGTNEATPAGASDQSLQAQNSQTTRPPLMSIPIQPSLPSGGFQVTSELNMFPTSLISGIPDAIRTRIWEGRYVDLATLIYKQDTAVRFNVFSSEESPELILNQRPSKTIKVIADWDRAFAKFHAIYIRRHPTMSEALIAHQQQVKKIAQAGGDWLTYDETFRRGVADGSISWGQMNPGLTMDAVLFANRRPFLSQQGQAGFKQKWDGKSSKANSAIPNGYCFAYHRHNTCEKTGCSWNHKCPGCHRDHSFQQCKGSSKTSKNPGDKKRNPDK